MRKLLNKCYIGLAAVSIGCAFVGDYRSSFTLFTIATLWGIEMVLYERTRDK